MSSWRDETGEQAQDDLDELVDVALRTGQERLDAAGEFYPFAVALDDSGGTDLVQPPAGAGKQILDVAEVHERCWQTLREDAGSLRAVAVVTNVGGPGGDAIAVALEHREGAVIEVFQTYKTKGKRNVYGDLSAVQGQPRVWA